MGGIWPGMVSDRTTRNWCCATRPMKVFRCGTPKESLPTGSSEVNE